jgi:hypothetical protein
VPILVLTGLIEYFNGFDSGNLEHLAGLAGGFVAPHLLVVGGKLVGFHLLSLTGCCLKSGNPSGWSIAHR